jgi:hypothetical protein
MRLMVLLSDPPMHAPYLMRNIDESHFAPDSVGKSNVPYQIAKRKKSEGSIKGIFYVECILFEFIS